MLMNGERIIWREVDYEEKKLEIAISLYLSAYKVG